MSQIPDHGHPRRWPVLVVLCVVTFAVSMQLSVLNTALPTLVHELGASDSELQWIVDSYVVVLAGLVLTGSAIADKYGRKKAVIVGLSITCFTVTGAAFSSDPIQLIVWRGLMGAGAALVLPATLSIIVDVFREAMERRKAISYWTLMNAIGAFFGPITGGLLLIWFSWRACFIANIPVMLVAIVLCALIVPDSHDPDAARFDLVGALLSTLALGTLIWAVIEGPSFGWSSLSIIAAFLAGITFAVFFVLWENHTATPMFRMTLFRSKQLTAAALTMTVAFVAMTGSYFLASISLQLVKGYSPLQAALATSGPIVVVSLLVMPRAPWVMQRFGLRRTIAFGAAMIGVAALMLTATSTTSPYWILGLGIAVINFSFSVFMPASTEAMMTSVAPEHSGSVSALNQITRQAGQALGIAVLGGIAAVGFQAHFASSKLTVPDVSADALTKAGDSFSKAVQLADSLPASVRAPLMDVASSSYVFGMRIALFAAAIMAFAVAAYALKAIPSQNINDEDLEPISIDVEVDVEDVST